jgi:uncharacterized protein (DUF433 family)
MPEVLRTETSWIEKTADVIGGDACIRGTRIAVWMLVEGRQVGMSDAQLLEAHPSLTPADLEIAWDYDTRHGEEIDLAIQGNDQA